MMGFYKSVHGLLGFPPEAQLAEGCRRCRDIPPPGGEGLRILAAEVAAESPEKGLPAAPETTDPGALGLHEIYDDGMGLCTESLGFESCDGREAELEPLEPEPALAEEGSRSDRRRLGGQPKREFPPPLRRRAFLKADRRDGRLVLTEVRIDRPKIFRASSQDGRLQLHLIELEESETVAELPAPEETEEEFPAAVAAEEEKEGRWSWRREEGFNRCQGAVSGNHVPLWCNHRFVTTA